MQALEFVARDPAGVLDHARQRERIVSSKLRIELLARGQQFAGALQIAQVCHRLAREDRIVGESALLRALDLSVPVGALDETHHQAAVEDARLLGQPVDDRRRPLLIGLHGKPEAFPAAQRGIGENRRDHIEGQLQPVSLLGIDREVEVMIARLAGELQEFGRKLLEHARAGDRLEARMQRGEFDRNTRPVGQRRFASRSPDGRDGGRIGFAIAVRVGGRAGAFPQHIERVAAVLVLGGPIKRLLDGLAQHEVGAEQPHRLAGRGAHRRQAETLDQRFKNRIRGFARLDDAGGDAKGPGRGRHQERIRLDVLA